MYVDSLYGEETPISELGKVKSFDDMMNWLGNTAMYAAYSPVDVMVGSLPVSRDVQFGLGGHGRTKNVSNWISRSMTDTTQAIEAMSDQIISIYRGNGIKSISKKEWKALIEKELSRRIS